MQIAASGTRKRSVREPDIEYSRRAAAETDTRVRDDLIASIAGRLSARSDDELAILDYVLGGLEYGATQYGPLNLASDTRDWDREGAQEARDLLVYEACRLIAAYRRRRA